MAIFLNENLNDVRVDYCLGTSANFTDSERNKRILQNFRDGIITIVVATNVLNEGIDISQCDLVISFDIENANNIIQKGGRARKEKSSIVIFYDEFEGEPETIMKTISSSEEIVNDFCKSDAYSSSSSVVTKQIIENVEYQCCYPGVIKIADIV